MMYAQEAIVLGGMMLSRRSAPCSRGRSADRILLCQPGTQQSVSPLSYRSGRAPIVALVRLCEAFPDHARLDEVVLGDRPALKYYQEAAAVVDAPYAFLPAAVYRESEATLSPKPRIGGRLTGTPTAMLMCSEVQRRSAAGWRALSAQISSLV